MWLETTLRMESHLIQCGLTLITFLTTETLHGTIKDINTSNISYLLCTNKECTTYQLLMLESQLEKITQLTKKELNKTFSLRSRMTRSWLDKYGQRMQLSQTGSILTLLNGGKINLITYTKTLNSMDCGKIWMKPLTSVLDHATLIKLWRIHSNISWDTHQQVETLLRNHFH